MAANYLGKCINCEKNIFGVDCSMPDNPDCAAYIYISKDKTNVMIYGGYGSTVFDNCAALIKDQEFKEQILQTYKKNKNIYFCDKCLLKLNKYVDFVSFDCEFIKYRDFVLFMNHKKNDRDIIKYNDSLKYKDEYELLNNIIDEINEIEYDEIYNQKNIFKNYLKYHFK